MKKKSAAPPRKSEASFSIPAGIVARSITWEPTLSVQDGEQGYLFRVYAPEAKKSFRHG